MMNGTAAYNELFLIIYCSIMYLGADLLLILASLVVVIWRALRKIYSVMINFVGLKAGSEL